MRGKRITEDQRLRILRAYKRGDTVKALADEYQISVDHISKMARDAGYHSRPVVSQVLRGEARMWERAKTNGAVVA